ncbi:XRE family transcriptional regulator [Spirosoma endbachense]|uniref:Helix-turn-helix domain-containing protein n=1 Tax=Spirosoma endbachense TaxID=2666025 RepID=A0A6P1W9M1_9BACT|nr:LexA family transcriptional regulator [Spirosoma endbachense]QHW01103.1 helix-turn-helix domain-containing protein [Spirosoma endbachense]
MEVIMTLGETLRKNRRAKNLTLQNVGEAVGLPYQSVQRWETDKAIPNAVQLTVLAKLFGISVDELLSEDFVMGDIKGILPFGSHLTINLPLITVANRTQLLNTFTNYDSVKSLNETFPVTTGIVPVQDNYVVIEIGSDIMEPKLSSGTKVLAEPISQENFPEEHGGVYAVLYNKKFAVRRIVNNDIAEHGKLFLNADNTKYDPIVVEATSIRAMWKVLRVVDAVVF